MRIRIQSELRQTSPDMKKTAPALVRCCACGRDISEHAETCPNCGQPHGVAAGLAGKRPLTKSEKYAIALATATLGSVLIYYAATGEIQRWLT